MGIDNKTSPTSISILIPRNEKYFDELEQVAENEGLNEDDEAVKFMSIGTGHKLLADEYYFDKESSSIVISGDLESGDNCSSYSITIPLSDTVLTDILQHGIQKFNKLKTALEALK